MGSTIFNVRVCELCHCMIKKQYEYFVKRYCTNGTTYSLKKPQIIHPYRKLHPWKSLEKFSQDLLNNVIYNKEGLVAINKPYGISARKQIIKEDVPKFYTKVPDCVDYTIHDSIPLIAKELGYDELVIVKTPERFMSGITLLAANDKIQNAINSSYMRSIGMKVLNKTYWIITVRVPCEVQGQQRLCMIKQFDSSKTRSKIVIGKSWSNNAEKYRRAKVLNVQFNMISNSTNNLCSLIEVKASTIKWHALRLFASTILYSPILGDNIHGTRIHKIGGKWLLVNPFLEVNHSPQVDKQVLELLYLNKEKQDLIPCHIHARQVVLTNVLGKESLTLEAPLIPPFDWTCKQLKFKNIPEFDKHKEAEVFVKV